MPAFDNLVNWGYSTVLTAPSPATSGTSLVVQSGDGAKFPTVSFNAWVWPPGVQPLSTNAEIVRVTNKSTDTFTITRAQEGSTARSIAVGWQIAAGATAKTLTDMQNSLNYAADAGVSDSYAITLAPVPTAYTTGQIVAFKANTANTGAATLNINSLGAKTIAKNVSSDLNDGDIAANQLVVVIYDGTRFQLVSSINGVQQNTWAAWTPIFSASGSMTFTSVTTNIARYIQVGKTVFYRVDCSSGTLGSTPNTSLFFTLPVTAKDTYSTPGSGLSSDSGGIYAAYTYFSTTSKIGVNKYNNSNYTVSGSSNTGFLISGSYEAA